MSIGFREGRQLCLFEDPRAAARLDQMLWYRSFDRRARSLHRLCPYEHRLPPALVQGLIELYSKPGDRILDPFCGSGGVLLEAALAGRQAYGADLNPYAYQVTRAKLEAPSSQRLAAQQAIDLLNQLSYPLPAVDLTGIPPSVQDFFHPATLQETIAAFQVFQAANQPFLTACLMGIVHHLGPEALSYPTQEEAPFLRRSTYPPEHFPYLYCYRDVRSRLLTKLAQVYRHHGLPADWATRQYRVWQGDARQIDLPDRSVDAIIASPPHRGAFDYVRNHRLRLWFLGYPHWQDLHQALICRNQAYPEQMTACLQEMGRVLKPGANCVLVVKDRARPERPPALAQELADIATGRTQHLTVETIYHYPVERPRSPNHKPKGDRRGLPLLSILVLRRN